MNIYSIIPAIPNGVLLTFMQILRRVHRKYRYSKSENRILSKEHIDTINKNHGFIEDQNSYCDIAYGKKTVKYSGCEVIATYNALCNMKDNRYGFIELLRYFEYDGCILSGNWGTAPKAIWDFFKREHYEVKEFNINESVDLSFDTFILVLYNDRYDIRKEIHTVCVTKDYSGYTAHNMYGNGYTFGSFDDINALLEAHNNGKAKCIYLFGIKRKNR